MTDVVTAAHIATFTSYDAVQIAGDAVYWIEGRPDEGSRDTLVRWRPDGGATEPLPAGYSVGTHIYGYGGGAYRAWSGGVFFSSAADGSVRASTPSGVTTIVHPSGGRAWYGDLEWVPGHRLLVAVRETSDADTEVSQLVAVRPGTAQTPHVLAEGADFYAAPRASPDGRWLAWLSWDHPSMPWDTTSLWLAPLDGDTLAGPARRVAGGEAESVFCPQWSPDGDLHFVSDRSGWWNLYRHRDGRIEPVVLGDAELGVAQWELGYSTYAFLRDGALAVIAQRGPRQQLMIGPPERPWPVELPYTSIKPYLASDGRRLAFIGSCSTQASTVVLAEAGPGEIRELADGPIGTAPPLVSLPERFSYRARDGHTCHGLYYPPQQTVHLPPLIIRAHPGPTANATERLDLTVQFFTQKGFAVADIDYRGSTGYGRSYRSALRLRWGILDPQDCADAATHLAATGRVDPAHMVISGASAGGYTALRALLEAGSPFAAATATSAIIDPAAWRRAAPRFQSRHADTLIGPWPEAADEYQRRSVLHGAARIMQPVLLMHGTADPITPAAQAEQLAASLKASGRRCTLLLFPGEGHNLRARTSIETALHAELQHYRLAFAGGSLGE